MYEHAAGHFSTRAFDRERAEACHREVLRYRQLPEVVVRVKAEKTFVENEWNTLTLDVQNTGFGPAMSISAMLDGPFDLSGQTEIAGVAPQRTTSMEVFVRPHEGQYGKVPLQIGITYEDTHDDHYDVSKHVPVRVVQKDAVTDTRTPLEMSIQDNLPSAGARYDRGADDESDLAETTPASAAKGAYTYDVFISYSHKDSEWVRDWLLPRLEGAGLRACIDFRNFDIGVPSIVNMENAVMDSRHVLLVITPNWVNSEWTNFEALMVQTEDPSGLRRRTIPLMLRQSKLPARIALLTYADFTDKRSWETEFQRIVQALKSS